MTVGTELRGIKEAWKPYFGLLEPSVGQSPLPLQEFFPCNRVSAGTAAGSAGTNLTNATSLAGQSAGGILETKKEKHACERFRGS